MTYRFDLTSSLDENIRRILCEQICKSTTRLSSKTSRKTAVHETRKSIKRIRALLKLIRPAIGKAIYSSENNRFRSIAASLSTTRDHDILTDALDTLEQFNGGERTPALKRARDCVTTVHDKQSHDTETAIRYAASALHASLASCSAISCRPDIGEPLQNGLAACYRAARKAQQDAYQNNDDETFHDWRKPVQIHWRQMALFRSAWPAEFDARIAMAKDLSENLGQDHDLKVLLTFLNKQSQAGELKAKDVRSIEALARACQTTLRRQSRPLGQILFQEPSRAHAKRIIGIWSSAAAAARASSPGPVSLRANGKQKPGDVPATTDAS